MDTAALKDRTRQSFEEIWNRKQRDRIDDFYSEDLIAHGFGAEEGGLETYKEWYDLITTAFPDIEFEVDQVFGEGDLVTATWRATATHDGPFMSIEPTGERAEVLGITVNRHDGDKTVESWMNFDSMKMLQTIGVVPELAPA